MPSSVDEAFFNRKEFSSELDRIIRHGDPNVLTAGYIRRQLEKALDLEEKELDVKPWKKHVNSMIDSTFANILAERANPAAQSTKEQPAADETADSHEEKDDMEEDEAGKDNEETKDASMDENENEESQDDFERELSDDESRSPKKKQNEASRKRKRPKMESDSDNDTKEKSPDKKKSAPKSRTRKSGSEKKASNETEETIKRLKMYIGKCGVRKIWQKELADCPTAAAQIRKLKAILADLGVEGRPTLEKCMKVKADRELKAEIESLDTGNILDKKDDGISLRSRNRRKRKIISDDEDSSSDNDGSHHQYQDDNEEPTTTLDVSFLGDQSSDSE